MELENLQPESFFALPRITCDLEAEGFSPVSSSDRSYLRYSIGGVHTHLKLAESGELTGIWSLTARKKFRSDIEMEQIVLPDGAQVEYNCTVSLFGNKPIFGSNVSGDENLYSDHFENQALNVHDLSPLVKHVFFDVSNRSGQEETYLSLSLDLGTHKEEGIGYVWDNKGRLIGAAFEQRESVRNFMESIHVDFTIDKDTHERICRIYFYETDTQVTFKVLPAMLTFKDEQQFIEHIKNGYPLFKSSAQIKFLGNK